MIMEYANKGALIRVSCFERYKDLLEQTGKYISTCLQSGKKILFCGNGGSAAEAQHMAAEYVGRFSKRERLSLPAIALTTDSSIITALANDYTFEMIFARQVEALGQSGDILIVSSTSGTSTNCIRAIEQANMQGLYTIGFTGNCGGMMKEMCKILFSVDCEETPIIQEVHIAMQHILCALVEKYLPLEYDRR